MSPAWYKLQVTSYKLRVTPQRVGRAPLVADCTAHLKEYAAWSTDTADCSDDPEEERRAGGRGTRGHALGSPPDWQAI